MKLIRLTLKNFMPYKGEAVLEFPQDRDMNTLVVMGDNMRGKTSLLNGIRWALYAKAQGRHLRSIPLHLMPNSEAAAAGDWTMEARIEFEAGGSRYDLRREATKRGTVAIPERPEDFQIFAYLKKDGAAVPADLIEAEINKFAPEQVSRFFLFDGELLQEYEELLIEGSDQGKKIKEAIEQALGVPSLIKGRDDLQVLLNRAQKEQGKEAALVKGLEAVAAGFQKWGPKREMAQADLETLKQQFSKIKDERTTLEDEISASEAVYSQKIELDNKVARRSELLKEIKFKNQKKLELATEAWRDILRPRLLAKKSEIQSALDEASKDIQTRAKLSFKIDHLRDHLDDKICQTCGQSIENGNRDIQLAQLASLENEQKILGISTVDANALSTALRSIDTVIKTSVKDRIADMDLDLSKMEVDVAKLENSIDDLQAELVGRGAEEIVRKRQQHQLLLRDEAKCQRDIEDRIAKVDEADRELKSLTIRMNAHDGRNSSRAALTAKAIEQLHSSFGSSIDQLRSNLRSTVEKNATAAFMEMSTQKSYKGLSINANYGLAILGEDGKTVAVRSAGAEQIVALSLIDGLSRAGRAAGPVVMDTPFGRLDKKHRKNILGYLPKAASQLVLFVHDGEMGEESDLSVLAHRIGGRYEIREVTPSHSVLEKK